MRLQLLKPDCRMMQQNRKCPHSLSNSTRSHRSGLAIAFQVAEAIGRAEGMMRPELVVGALKRLQPRYLLTRVKSRTSRSG